MASTDMKTNYILIDFENVNVANLALLNGHPVKVLIFVGAKQTKIPVELAKSVQAFGTNAEYIQLSASGPNALDFHIAFTIGQLSVQEPDAFFHIISKDAGFDPLIDYSKKRNIRVHRSNELSRIPILRTAIATLVNERVDVLTNNLAKRGSNRPKTTIGLSNTINTLCGKALGASEIQEVIEALQQGGYISIDDTKVTYHLPSPS